MKKMFSEAEVELTLISAFDDVLTASGPDADVDAGGLGSVVDGWDEG